MEGTLLVTPEKLHDTANQFQAKANEVKTLHDDMLGKVNSLSNSWTGNAGDAYRAKFSALQDSIEQINRMILEHVNDLNDMADQYTTAETSASNAANDLPQLNLD